MSTTYGTNNDIQAPVTVSNISNIVTNQLRLYYDLARSNSYPGSGAILYDISGNNTHATMYNAGGTTYSTLPVGPPTYIKTNLGEFVFDGVNDWGKFTTFTTTAAFSVSAWVKFTNAGDRGILSHCSGGPVGESYGFNGGKMFYQYYTNNAWQAATGTTSVNDGAWKNIVFAKNGTNMVMYINGVQDFTTTLVGSVTSSINTIGSKWGPCNSDNYGAGTDSYPVFSGSLATLMLHTKQLSASEVLQNYNNLKSRFGL